MFSITRVPNPRCVGVVTVGPPDSVQRNVRLPYETMRFQRHHPLPIAIRILPRWSRVHATRSQSPEQYLAPALRLGR